MTAAQILMLFLGLPLAILAMGLRRALGGRRFLILVLCAAGIALYDLLVGQILTRLGVEAWSFVGDDPAGRRQTFLAVGGCAWLGMLAAVLLRFRGRGSEGGAL